MNTLLVALAINTAIALPPEQPQKPVFRALLVGVSQYRDAEAWRPLSGDIDVALIKGALTEKFQATHDLKIMVLDKPETTTRSAILGAFKKHLVDDATKTDVLYFHFSGHGTQVPDLDGDEPDGADEALVPSDAKGFDPKTLIIDDEIGLLLKQVKSDNLTMSFDSCHSGDISRGGVARGKKNPAVEVLPQNPSRIIMEGDELDRAVVFSAASPRELAFERPRVGGFFTHGWVKALNENSGSMTAGQALDRVLAHVSTETRAQSPRLAGDHQRVLFGVEMQPRTLAFSASGLYGYITLRAGQLHGISENSEIGLYSAGSTRLEGEPLLRARVTRVDVTESEAVILDDSGKPVSGSDYVDHVGKSFSARVLVPGIKVAARVNFSDLRSTPAGSAIADKLIAKYQTIEEVEDDSYDFVIRDLRKDPQARGGVNAAAVFALADRAAHLADLEERSLELELDAELEKRIRAYLIQKIQPTGAVCPVSLEVRIVRITTEPIGNRVRFTGIASDQSPQYTFQDVYAVQVRALGPWAPYLNVLTFPPSGSVGVMWPPKDLSPDRTVVPNDGKWYWLSYSGRGLLPEGDTSTVNPFGSREEDGVGVDLLRFVISRTPANYHTMIGSRSGPASGRGRGFEELFRRISGGTRSGSLAPEPSEWTLVDVPVLVVGK
jgi:hypothetical protein